MEISKDISRFIDGEGKITQLPKKQSTRLGLLSYLAEKFEFGTEYTERQVNEICESWHTFGDLFLLRQELIESGLLERKRDGSKYWRPKKKENEE